jgi:hypothetical protein
LRQLLKQFVNPSPEFFDAVLDGSGTTTEHDRKRIRQDIFPDIVKDFAKYADELESLGLIDAADIIRDEIIDLQSNVVASPEKVH